MGNVCCLLLTDSFYLYHYFRWISWLHISQSRCLQIRRIVSVKSHFQFGVLELSLRNISCLWILFSNIYCSHVSGKNLWPLVICSIAYVQGLIPSMGYEKQAEVSAECSLEENHQFCAQQGGAFALLWLNCWHRDMWLSPPALQTGSSE